ncbi:MAG: M48 family metalloprotease, partial [Gemmatimonadetes bacterium]|nr:M48 family metalloprotease [Gemmatimonadota bacterium]
MGLAPGRTMTGSSFPAVGPSLTRRALIAVALLVGFYLLGLAIAAALLAMPWALWEYADRLNTKLALFSIVGAGAILWGLLPRRDRFEPPGPVLTADDQPELFALLRDVAQQTGQAMPAQVFLVGDLNAWVAQRGGFMGIGSQRVMGVGLPLLQALSVDEFRGVIAHEFGHYHGGDTALGPWLYRTRAAIGRTLHTLAHHSEVLMKPFEWYGNAFLRVTHAISRQQEFVADRVAADIVGRDAMRSGLRTIHALAGAYDAYWRSEVVPALQSGWRPPVAAGFAHFVSVPGVASQVSHALEAALHSTEAADPYDTHPPLTERLAALESAAAAPRGSDPRRSISLIQNLPTVEAQLLAFLTDNKALTTTSWELLAEQSFVPAWHAVREAMLPRLRGWTVGQLAAFVGHPDELRDTWAIDIPRDTEPEDGLAQIAGAAGSCLGSALVTAGATVHTLPGEPVVLHTST